MDSFLHSVSDHDQFKFYSTASGKAAKDKREKDEKNQADKSALPPRPPTRRGRHTADMSSQMLWPSSMKLYHDLLPSMCWK